MPPIIASHQIFGSPAQIIEEAPHASPVFRYRRRPARQSWLFRLMILSLVTNLVLLVGVWWFTVERPRRDLVRLMELSDALVALDQPVADNGAVRRYFITERRSVLLAESTELLRAMDDVDPTFLAILYHAYQQQGDDEQAIALARQIAENGDAPLGARLTAYRALGQLYAEKINASPGASDDSFLAALRLVRGTDEPQAHLAAVATDMDWASVALRRGIYPKAFEHLAAAFVLTTDLPCAQPQRNPMLRIIFQNLGAIASRNPEFAERLQNLVASRPDACVPVEP